MKYALKISVAIIVVLIFTSCASTKSSRKCNGRKGIDTPMGKM